MNEVIAVVVKEKEAMTTWQESEYLSTWTQGSDCVHNNCPSCKGTGYKPDGTQCIHMISCQCNKCSPRMVY